jgi:hypothetical protein
MKKTNSNCSALFIDGSPVRVRAAIAQQGGQKPFPRLEARRACGIEGTLGRAAKADISCANHPGHFTCH